MAIQKQQKYKYIIYEKWGRIAYITINRPEVLNATHTPALVEINSIVSDFIDDDDVWVAILTGTGERAFSAGADLKYFSEKEHQEDLRRPELHVKHVLDDCPKPVIAAVNGYAVGGGLELALRCDIIVAAEHARFGLPEPRRGLMADTGGVLKLPKRIPFHVAMGLILTGKLITAQEAFRIGLINEVVPMSDLLETARGWAQEILECSPLAVQAAKEVVLKSMDSSNGMDPISMEKINSLQRLRSSEDYKEGPMAFAEKRKPVWKGK